jgi:hypothetical protein
MVTLLIVKIHVNVKAKQKDMSNLAGVAAVQLTLFNVA